MSEHFPPDTPSYYTPPQGPRDKLNWAATTGLVLGCCNILSWIIPLCGCPVGICGIVFSAIGLNSSKRNLALTGLIMSIISILLTIANALLGVWMQQNHKGIWAPPP
jgi:hypothetical protein